MKELLERLKEKRNYINCLGNIYVYNIHIYRLSRIVYYNFTKPEYAI